MEAFEDIKKAINDCPTLAFLQTDGPIFLQTDASDYGVGGYLFQHTEKGDQPVAFVSKLLNKSQREKWAANEKEAFAIWFSIMELEYLIRDVHFTLRTDHRNLTFINTAGSPRVLRWKLAIQEFNFELEYLSGPSNFVADALSRDFEQVQRVLAVQDPFVEGEMLMAMVAPVTIPHENYSIIAQVHNSTVGHHGVDRTMVKLAQKGHHWQHIRLQVRTFIQRCPCCQKMRTLAPLVKTVRYTTARYEPMERINIDTIGPLPSDQKATNSFW